MRALVSTAKSPKVIQIEIGKDEAGSVLPMTVYRADGQALVVMDDGLTSARMRVTLNGQPLGKVVLIGAGDELVATAPPGASQDLTLALVVFEMK